MSRGDEYRVVGYSGGELVAVGSRDRVVRLTDVSDSKEASPLIRGHAGSIRALLLCEQRNLLITASYHLSIRCWDLKTGASTMVLRGHMGTINCLDVHANTLVSGAKDCKVKVWDLATGKCFENLKFKHHSAVWCVKIDTMLLLSSCDKGLVKMWDTEIASLLEVIDAHQSAVKCLFFDSYHIMSGGSDGLVMAWSTNVNAKGCLMTFHHPREVRSVTLSDLRVITGCTDERVHIFSLLTGHCLRIIQTESPILSIHTHANSMIVNTRSSVLLTTITMLPAQAGKYYVNTKVEMTHSERAAYERLLKNKALRHPLSAEAILLKGHPQAPQPPATQDKHLKQPLSCSPRDDPMDTFREQVSFRLLTDMQLKEHVRVLSQDSAGRQQRRSKTAEDRQRRMIWRMKIKGLSSSDYTKEDQVYAPELGHDTYI
uniref:F-box/WD repeat-containing protein 10-like n=1 Tax=Centroberyx gerrardi TaxID=166262 RepID=UPI003AAADEC9